MFETPNEVDKLANFIAERITEAKEKIAYVAFLFANRRIWSSLKKAIERGVDITIIAPPITSYSGEAFQEAFKIYSEAGYIAKKAKNLQFYVCPLWWQKDPEVQYLRSLINIPYTLHAKLLVIDGILYLPSSNFESAKHYDLCIYLDDKECVRECELFVKDLKEHSIDITSTDFSSEVAMIKEAVKITLKSTVTTQKPFPHKRMLFIAPFYKYEPENYVRLNICEVLKRSKEYISIMFQHFMPDVSEWSYPKSPSIIETVVAKHNEGVNVRLLAASGVVNPKAVRAEQAPILKPLYETKKLVRNAKVHAKFFSTDYGFLAGSLNINPASLYQGYFDKERIIKIPAALHILLQDAIPEEFIAKKYGSIWELPGFKSSVEVLLIDKWDAENTHIRDKLNDFFNNCWVRITGGQSKNLVDYF